MSKRAVTAVLTKQDFLDVLYSAGKLQQEEKINQILQFNLFKNVSKGRIKVNYRLFFDNKTQ